MVVIPEWMTNVGAEVAESCRLTKFQLKKQLRLAFDHISALIE
jgi:hypothetical protein